MRKLKELIKELGSKEVEYKKFYDIAIYVRGVSYKKSKEINDGKAGYKLLRANNISLSSNTLNFDDVKIIDFSVKIKDSQWLKKNDILICAGSGSKEHIGKVAFIEENMGYTFGGFMGVIRVDGNRINAKYLFHIMTSPLFKEHLSKVSNTSTIHNINNDTWKDFKIPVPPLEVQKKIVHILDHFTLLSTELSAELKTRQKQYRYYKEKMLEFSKNDTNIKWVNLGTYCKKLTGTAITAGKMKEMIKEDGTLKIFAGGRTVITTDEDNIPKEDIIKVPNIIVQSRGIIDFIYYDKPCSYKREMWSYTNDNIVTLKYIYYYLKNNVKFFRQRGSQRGSMPQISLNVTERFKIPIPKYEEQERIVNILDKFDKLCNDVSEGLPAEIEARKKQYQYYRDKLLTFHKVSY